LLGCLRQHALSNTAYVFQSPLSFCPLLHARNQAWDNQHELQKISAAGAGSYE
jgi:hypothetical protein